MCVLQKIIVKTDGKEVVVEQGGVTAAPADDTGKTGKKTGKASLSGTGPMAPPAAQPKLGGGVGGGVVATAGGTSVVVASVLPSSKKQVMAAAKSGKGTLQVTAPPQPCKCSCDSIFIASEHVYVTCC